LIALSLPAPLVRPHGHWTDNPEVSVTTSLGAMRIELNPQFAPATVANWLGYVNSGFFDGLIFHRVIDDFMVQGGGFSPDLAPKTALYAPLKLESNTGLANTLGSLAMARTNDPHSATSQFFINDQTNAFLNYSGYQQPGYAVFGQVVEGLDVVQTISKVSTTTEKGLVDVPLVDVAILEARQIHEGALKSVSGLVSLTLNQGAGWSYSLNHGQSWQTGQGPDLVLAEGVYESGQVQVRQNLQSVTSQAVLLPAMEVVSAAPRVEITSTSQALGRNQTAQIQFTLSEPSTNFAADDVMVLGGRLVGFQGSGTQYTATLLPNVTAGHDTVVQVPTLRFTNAAGQGNLESVDQANALVLPSDALPPAAPILLNPGIWLKNPEATLHFSSGDVKVELLADKAPLQVANWLSYVNADAYAESVVNPVTNTSFSVATMGLAAGEHGVVQTPLFTSVPSESGNGASNTLGTLASLKANNNTASNGFFVNLANNAKTLDFSAQDPGYTVFGQTLTGSEVWASIGTEPSTLMDVTHTVPGTVRVPTAQISVQGLALNAAWRYSLDAGQSWQPGTTPSLNLSPGTYLPHQIQVQVQGADAVGNTAALSSIPHTLHAGVTARHWARADQVIQGVQVTGQDKNYVVSGPTPTQNNSGIGLNDVLMALKLYLGKPVGDPNLLGFQSVAADMDGNGKVDLSDVLNLLKIYLDKPTSLDVQPKWVFLDASLDDWGNNTSKLSPNNTLPAKIDWQNHPDGPVELIGVFRGDVDGSGLF
jgi:peptidyl-prolyl cis-trans isomerase B (cyclophilin B)